MKHLFLLLAVAILIAATSPPQPNFVIRHSRFQGIKYTPNTNHFFTLSDTFVVWPTTDTNQHWGYFQCSSNLTDWTTFFLFPYPTQTLTVSVQFQATDHVMFFRAGAQ